MSVELRASDADREQAVVRLRDAAAEGRLTLEELSERVAAAYAARTHAELEPLTGDLPPAPSSRRRPTRWLVGVFSSVERSGRLDLALFGGLSKGEQP